MVEVKVLDFSRRTEQAEPRKAVEETMPHADVRAFSEKL
jgi:hypothetical protein